MHLLSMKLVDWWYPTGSPSSPHPWGRVSSLTDTLSVCLLPEQGEAVNGDCVELLCGEKQT